MTETIARSSAELSAGLRANAVTAAIVDAWSQAGIATRFAEVPGANHFTAIAPLADPHSPMTRRLLDLAIRQ
jgi:hypothetical protein